MKTLSPREEELMDLMWKHGPMFVNEMLEHFREPRPHFNTISTFIRGLEKKGLVSHKSYGPTYQYFPVLTRDEFQKHTLKSVVSKYFNNSYLGIVSSLVREEQISLDELKELIAMVENEKQSSADNNK